MKTLKQTLVAVLTFVLMISNVLCHKIYAQENSDATLKVGLAVLPDNLDPGYAGGNYNIKFFYNMYDSLFYTTDKGEIANRLATEYKWEDDTTLVVKIQEGVKFHNGEELTAEDVKYTYDRILSGYGDGTVSTLYSSLDSVDMVDDSTVQFNLKQKDNTFMLRLSTVWAPGIVPKDYIEEKGDEGFATEPIGAGPYKLASFGADKIVLERFDEYWGEKAPLKSIEFIMYPETAGRVSALVGGEVDMIVDIPADQVETMKSYADIKVDAIPLENIHIYTFDAKMKDSIISNKEFRQALTHAIDRKTLVEKLWNGMAKETIGHQFEAYGDLYLEDYDYPKYDPELAKELVKKSGYDGKEVIEIGMADGYYALGNEAGQAIVSMFNDIGVKAEVKFLTEGSPKTQLGAWSNSARFASPLGSLYQLFGPGSKPADPKDGKWDPTERFIKAGETLMTSDDLEEQKEAARALMEEFDQNGVGTYLYQPAAIYGYKNNIEWNTYFVKNHVTPFRAGDITIK